MPMVERGLSLVFLQTMLVELGDLGRADYDGHQLLNGGHTADSKTDWQEFSRERDFHCLKSCILYTGLSFAETCMDAEITTSYEHLPVLHVAVRPERKENHHLRASCDRADVVCLFSFANVALLFYVRDSYRRTNVCGRRRFVADEGFWHTNVSGERTFLADECFWHTNVSGTRTFLPNERSWQMNVSREPRGCR